MNRTLLIIDVQNEYFTGQLPVTYPANSLENILKVMAIALEKQIPVVVVQHTETEADSPVFKQGTPEWNLHPEIAKQTWDLHIEKNLPGSFTNTGLEEWLRERDIDTIVIAGYMTQMCCDTTARQALHRGFSVEFLSDATGTLAFKNNAGSATDEELHRAILVSQDGMISTVVSTSEWIDRLEPIAVKS
jgi:nicotinamidase-related amidase